MTVYDLQHELLRLEKEGLQLRLLYMQYLQYPVIPFSSIPGYNAWLNNLYQYEQRYLSGHPIHSQFQSAFDAAGNSSEGFSQLLQCLSIINHDQLFWDSIKQKGLNVFEDNGMIMQGENQPLQAYNQSALPQQIKPTVFLSYNWGSDKTANQVEERLKPIADVLRDKSSIGPWGSITEYMKHIRMSDLVVVIISDEYLKSVACLYEVMQLLKNENWISHSMFIVEDSAKGLYNPVGQLDYVKYWESERNSLEKAMQGMDPALVTSQADALKKIKNIQLNLNDFMKGVADRNNPDLTQAIDAVERRVRS